MPLTTCLVKSSHRTLRSENKGRVLLYQAAYRLLTGAVSYEIDFFDSSFARFSYQRTSGSQYFNGFHYYLS
jgi:hypothetical protein